MKALAVMLCLMPIAGFASSIYPAEREALMGDTLLKESEERLSATLAEIRWLYQEDLKVVAAFESAQRKWEDYREATIAARFPDKVAEKNFTARIAYAKLRRAINEARSSELSVWCWGADDDSGRGTLKTRKEVDEKKRRAGTAATVNR